MENNKNIAIIGSRDFNDFNILEKVLLEITSIEGLPKSIVSGGAKGADTLGFDWAKKNSIDTILFEPKYKDFPKKVRKWMAPKERNTTIVENSDLIVAFWDMSSTGTKDTIDKSVKNNKKVYLYNTIENKLSLYYDEII